MRFLNKKTLIMSVVALLLVAAGAFIAYQLLNNNNSNLANDLDKSIEDLVPTPSVITVKSVDYSNQGVVSGPTSIDNANEIIALPIQTWPKANFDLYTATFELKTPENTSKKYVNGSTQNDTVEFENQDYILSILWDSVGVPIAPVAVTNNSLVSITTELGQKFTRGESNGTYYYFANLLNTTCEFQGVSISAPCGKPSVFVPLQDGSNRGYSFGLSMKCTGDVSICDAMVSTVKWIKSDPNKFNGNTPIITLKYESDRVLTWTVSGDATGYDTTKIIWSKSPDILRYNPTVSHGEFTTATAYKYGKITRVDGPGTYNAIACLVNKDIPDSCYTFSNLITFYLEDVGTLVSDIDLKFNKESNELSWVTNGYAEDGFLITFSDADIPDSGFPAATYSQVTISDPVKRNYTLQNSNISISKARICAISYERGYIAKCGAISEQVDLTKTSEPFVKSINLSVDTTANKLVWNVVGTNLSGFKIIGSYSPIPTNGIPYASYTHSDVAPSVREYDLTPFKDYTYIRVCAKDQNVYGGWCGVGEAISNEVNLR